MGDSADSLHDRNRAKAVTRDIEKNGLNGTDLGDVETQMISHDEPRKKDSPVSPSTLMNENGSEALGDDSDDQCYIATQAYFPAADSPAVSDVVSRNCDATKIRDILVKTEIEEPPTQPYIPLTSE